jgi:hypothetical protein
MPGYSYLTCWDCLDLSIFYADNLTMHGDQIQWKLCYWNSFKYCFSYVFFIILSEFYGKQYYFQNTLWVCISLAPFRRINDNNFSGKLPTFISKWTKVQKLWVSNIYLFMLRFLFLFFFDNWLILLLLIYLLQAFTGYLS